MIPLLLWLPLITSVLTVGMVYFLIRCWKDRYWGLLWRLHYTLVTLAAFALIPLLGYWNLLGFKL